MHLEARGLARLFEPVAYLFVFGAERQSSHAALWCAAEFRGFVNRIPEAGGIDLQIGGDLAHAAVFRNGGHSDCFSMTRRRRPVNQGRSTARFGERARRRVRRRPCRGMRANLPKTSAARL